MVIKIRNNQEHEKQQAEDNFRKETEQINIFTVILKRNLMRVGVSCLQAVC